MIEQGDRVTIEGREIRFNGRQMIDATRLTVNDETMWNAKDKRTPRQMSRR
jgi:hypothetical protein